MRKPVKAPFSRSTKFVTIFQDKKKRLDENRLKTLFTKQEVFNRLPRKKKSLDENRLKPPFH